MVVLKAGGDLATRPDWLAGVAREVVTHRERGEPVVVVHGGGPQLDDALCTAGIPVERFAGRRATTPAVLSRAVEIWRGTLSTLWVRAIQEAGALAVGLSGVDGQMLVAERRAPVEIDGAVVDFGEVGDLRAVERSGLQALMAAGFVPVVSPLAVTRDGAVLNVNADTVAAHLAVALDARELVLLTRAPGILSDPDDAGSALDSTSLRELASLERLGAIQGGMRPKIAAIRVALEGGVGCAWVRDGRFGSAGRGTRVALAG